MRRAYKFRAYPTRPQEGRAVRLLADHCDLYNAALEERREAWRMRRSDHLRHAVRAAAGIRQRRPGGPGTALVHRPAADPPPAQRRVRRVLRRALKTGKKPGYPRFKPYSRFDQVRFVAGDGAKWSPAGPGGWARAAFQAVGSVKVRQHRPVPGTVKALQLKREHRRWYVIVIADTEPVPLPPAGREVGVDVGVARFLTTSRRRGRRQPEVSRRVGRGDRGPAAPQGPRQAADRGTASGSAARWPRSGARSATGAATSTTKPRGRWSTPAT